MTTNVCSLGIWRWRARQCPVGSRDPLAPPPTTREEGTVTPEEKREDAVKAAREWRDEERGQRRVWVDSGSGPGFEVLIERPKLRPDRDKLS